MSSTAPRIRYAEFAEYCEQATILPGIALENDHIANAIKSRDRKELWRVLTEEF